jgi:glucose-6-phosphate 1-dehydrogenase
MSHTLVIFGASGDLTSRKLIPALYLLFTKERLPPETRIVGVSRTPYSHQAWRDELAKSVAEAIDQRYSPEKWAQFADSIFYHPGDISDDTSFAKLTTFLNEQETGAAPTRLYYLATAPRFYQPAVAALGRHNLADQSHGPRRIVIEKPFGVDFKSAHALNEAVHAVFNESQVFRIDHYLGKETVQNLAVLRFANTIFEPIWNRNYIDHVQITVAEEEDIGHRGDYYDSAGVLRDMFQNHLLQLLTITAMEPPVRFEADAIRNEKVQVLQAISPMTPEEIAASTVRGQYRGYRSAENVRAGSQTATFAAVRLNIENWRWQGVPFYLRSGKAMSCRTTQIVVQFREPPYMMFGRGRIGAHEANRLIIQVQPAEGIQLQFQTKVPDSGMRLRTTDLDFRFAEAYAELPDAYQRLLVDALNGDASLFARADEVERAWLIIDPIVSAWDQTQTPPLYEHEPGLWGPTESTTWLQAQNRQWFDTCPVLHERT